MRFMNEFDIDAAARYADHPVLGPAVQTLAALRDWTNANSDGWAYWPKPARAAARLMDLIERDRFDDDRPDATAAELTKALAPVKAFRTRQRATFTITAA